MWVGYLLYMDLVENSESSKWGVLVWAWHVGVLCMDGKFGEMFGVTGESLIVEVFFIY